ncbi:hypothetical protein FLK61_23270 [Paenalkalicoccus suaedae]|uniref:Uncharacterized protein n=1 Tax=Paenalkalicoccus suaedae TaxID=2592382 RepID=A0A859FA22_9BACI|nr:hypothetical protein [Paenalkalicoccus suaedae]QKS69720.1 hypothetical protein FLK61_23270 [Paenalkalicoccus suaedae]
MRVKMMLIIIAMLTVACQSPSISTDVVATIDGEEITEEEVYVHRFDYSHEHRESIIRYYVEELVVVEEAEAQGFQIEAGGAAELGLIEPNSAAIAERAEYLGIEEEEYIDAYFEPAIYRHELVSTFALENIEIVEGDQAATDLAAREYIEALVAEREIGYMYK